MYCNAQKNEINVQKAKGEWAKIKPLTYRMRKVHIREFLSSPIVRAVASSIVEAAGALMVVSGIASVTAAATAGCK